MNDDQRFWRTLAEHEGEYPRETPEFAAPLAPPTSEERRRFLQLSGASLALAGAAACRFKEDKILPHTQQPEGVIPGVPQYFMTAMDLGGAAVGLKVKSYDGRPIKVDGNPNHPDSLGATRPRHQACVLELYDPDRSTGFARRGEGGLSAATETEFRVFAREHFRALGTGRGLRVLAGASSSPSVGEMKARLLARFPESKWYEYEPAATTNEWVGSQLAFGAPHRAHLRLSRAKVIVCLDADIIASRPDSPALARAWAAGRQPESGEMNRLYAFESSLSETGSVADHRFSLRSEHIKAVAAFVDAEVSRHVEVPPALGPAQPVPAARFLDDPALQKVLRAAVSDLIQHRAAGLVVAGASQPPEVHAVVHRINQLLGNSGKTVEYSAASDGRVFDGRASDASGSEPSAPPSPAESIAALAAEMAQGQVDTLLILGSNPVYTRPADVDFVGALAKVKTKICHALYQDETAQACDWHVPEAHFLEAWGDTRASDGTIGIQQPLIAPLYGGKSLIELLAILTNDSVTTGLEIVQRSLHSATSDPRLWRKSLHDGVVPGTAWALQQPALRPLPPMSYSAGELSGLELEAKELELTLAVDPKIYDGRFANNGWLQELPDFASKLTWDNALMISPKTAQSLGIADGMRVHVSIDGRTLLVPALLSPGQATGSVKLYLGYGRTAAGNVAGRALDSDEVTPVGINAYQLRSKRVWSFARGASVIPTSEHYRLATTQDKHSMDRIGKFGTAERLPMLVRQASLEEYEKEPDFAKHAVHHPPLLSLWKEPVSYDRHKWGMSIDLNKCTGCSGCVVACQAENNVPIVGKERVYMGREMQWLRIDRYFQGDPEQPSAVHQPIPCMQCEHAPCEQVCPVGATSHSHEGLNDMTYNRCIGTRYCSNNCPYKVRKFNFFNFHEDLKDEHNEVKRMVFNPDVTVRFRGVMEKCTYCVQRIQEGKLRADRENRPLADGEVTTACQDSCPTRAIVFGDMNDPKSEVSARKGSPRDYSLLEELNVRPRTTYMARVRNPHPELG